MPKICTLAKFLNLKGHVLAVHVTLLFLGFYFPIQKLTDLSASDFLAHIFSLKFAVVVKTAGILWVVYCAFAKTGMLILEHYPIAHAKLADPDSINECALRANDEIRRHLDKIYEHPAQEKRAFPQGQAFEVNVALVVANMANHLIKSFPGLKVKSKHIFISVYQVPNFEACNSEPTCLEYVTHHDHKLDLVYSRKINLADPNYSDYESVKTILEELPVKVKWDCCRYAKSKTKRHKTIQHYVGFRLHARGKTIGFINVEFHAHKFFQSDEAMVEFVERDLHPFRTLIEYQFLQKMFLQAVQTNLVG